MRSLLDSLRSYSGLAALGVVCRGYYHLGIPIVTPRASGNLSSRFATPTQMHKMDASLLCESILHICFGPAGDRLARLVNRFPFAMMRTIRRERFNEHGTVSYAGRSHQGCTGYRARYHSVGAGARLAHQAAQGVCTALNRGGLRLPSYIASSGLASLGVIGLAGRLDQGCDSYKGAGVSPHSLRRAGAFNMILTPSMKNSQWSQFESEIIIDLHEGRR